MSIEEVQNANPDDMEPESIVRDEDEGTFIRFTDLVNEDDRSVQKILREVDFEYLATALTPQSLGEVREKIFLNMSKRAAVMLREDIESLGTEKKADDVRDCQKKILELMVRLIKAGEILIPSESAQIHFGSGDIDEVSVTDEKTGRTLRFAGLAELPDEDFQKVLSVVDQVTLMESLFPKSAEAVRDRVFSCLFRRSKKAYCFFLEDIEFMGPNDSKRVERAQKKILSRALSVLGTQEKGAGALGTEVSGIPVQFYAKSDDAVREIGTHSDCLAVFADKRIARLSGGSFYGINADGSDSLDDMACGLYDDDGKKSRRKTRAVDVWREYIVPYVKKGTPVGIGQIAFGNSSGDDDRGPCDLASHCGKIRDALKTVLDGQDKDGGSGKAPYVWDRDFYDDRGFDIEKGVLYSYSGTESSVAIPRGVKQIGDFAFANCTALKSVSIPSSVREIGGSAFLNCTALESIILPKRVTSIGDGTFMGCTALKSVTIPGRVTEIKDMAFAGCTALTSVCMGKKVTAIGIGAFSECASLASLALPKSLSHIGILAFSGSPVATLGYAGTKAQWDAVEKGWGWHGGGSNAWNEHIPAKCVACPDGTVDLE